MALLRFLQVLLSSFKACRTLCGLLFVVGTAVQGDHASITQGKVLIENVAFQGTGEDHMIQGIHGITGKLRRVVDQDADRRGVVAAVEAEGKRKVGAGAW